MFVSESMYCLNMKNFCLEEKNYLIIIYIIFIYVNFLFYYLYYRRGFCVNNIKECIIINLMINLI